MSDDFNVTGPADEYTEMRTLCDAHGGRVTPEQVLERASDPTSSFHRHITWDVDEAAHKFQLQQAGGIIRKFKVQYDSGGRIIKAAAFVRVPDSTDGYMPLQQAMTMEWVMQGRRMSLIASMERLAQELSHWTEFAALAEALNAAIGNAAAA